MRAALVAARNESAVAGLQFLQSLQNVLALDLNRVGGRADEDEVVVHHGQALEGKAFGHHFFFGHLVMHKQHIGVTAAAHVDGLTGAQCHHLDINARGFFEFREQKRKQAGLLGRGGRSHHDVRALSLGQAGACKKTRPQEQR